MTTTKKKRKPAKKAKRKPAKKAKKTTSGERTKLAAFCPDYMVDEDDDGQIVIYTGLRDDGDDNYVPTENYDEADEEEWD